MPCVSLHARSAALSNRGGVASSSSTLSIIKRAPPLPARRKAEKNTTASAPPRRSSLLSRLVPRASLWDSLFGGDKSGGGGSEGEKTAKKQEEEDFDLLDPRSLPACLPEAVLSRTFLAGRALAVSYVASKDGWSALRFHERCDFKGPSLVVAETSDGAVFGGYFSDCWTSSDDYSTSWKPFLFAFSDEKKGPLEGREVFICEKVGGPEAALFDLARGGPQFGSDGLLIGPPLSPVMGGFAGPDSPTQGAGALRTAKSRLGLSYAELPKRRDGRRRSLFGKGAEGGGGGGGERRDEATLKEVTVYFAPELAKRYR